jgi:hypothetical protein
MLEILNSGELGSITKVRAWPCFRLLPASRPRASCRRWVSGTRDTMRVLNPYVPQLGNRLVVRSDTPHAVEHGPRQPSSYVNQLRAFTRANLRA